MLYSITKWYGTHNLYFISVPRTESEINRLNDNNILFLKISQEI